VVLNVLWYPLGCRWVLQRFCKALATSTEYHRLYVLTPAYAAGVTRTQSKAFTDKTRDTTCKRICHLILAGTVES